MKKTLFALTALAALVIAGCMNGDDSNVTETAVGPQSDPPAQCLNKEVYWDYMEFHEGHQPSIKDTLVFNFVVQGFGGLSGATLDTLIAESEIVNMTWIYMSYPIEYDKDGDVRVATSHLGRDTFEDFNTAWEDTVSITTVGWPGQGLNCLQKTAFFSLWCTSDGDPYQAMSLRVVNLPDSTNFPLTVLHNDVAESKGFCACGGWIET